MIRPRRFDEPVVMVSSPGWTRAWAYVLALHGLYAGVGYAFGPAGWSSTPSLSVVRDFPVPVMVWGLLMMVYGAIIFTTWAWWGHALAGLVWGFWAACIWMVSLSELLEAVFGLDLGTEIVAWGGGFQTTIICLLHCYLMLPHRKLSDYVREATPP